MQVLVILQARVSSSRLPGKVLKTILDKTMLAHQIERLQLAKNFDKLIVATSSLESDKKIVSLCRELAIDCFQGDINDVLNRYYQAAKVYQPQHIVRVTGDCPLIDAEIVDQVIALHLQGSYDYSSNIAPPTLPDGLDVEIFTFKALEIAWQKSKSKADREHVTLFIRNNPQLFKCQNYCYPNDLSHLRWTVDEVEDFEFVSAIYQKLYRDNPNFSLNDVLELLNKEPELALINDKFTRNQALNTEQLLPKNHLISKDN